MDPQLADPIIVDITANKIFTACFKQIFKGRNDLQAGDEEIENMKLCSKNFIQSFSVVSEGYQEYLKSLPKPQDYVAD